jgi:pimeloyl-ACP methyl ester carboxylesterase
MKAHMARQCCAPFLERTTMRLLATASVMLLTSAALGAQSAPKAIWTDPPHDKEHPARMEVLHVPSGGVKINGIALLAPGAGVHPTLVFLHGLPGNEKNIDLLQAVRRAGWNAVTINYRGSWGSPGGFRFDNTLADAAALLAFLRAPANSVALGIDTTHLVLAGHSMGGWVTAMTASRDRGLAGAVLISAANMGAEGGVTREQATTMMADNMESLAGGTAETFGEDLRRGAEARNWSHAVSGLARLPLLVLTADDGLAPASDSLVATLRRAGDHRVTVVHEATDHSWSDRRIALESAVLRWQQQLPARPAAH